jgi:hypothetical protein
MRTYAQQCEPKDQRTKLVFEVRPIRLASFPGAGEPKLNSAQREWPGVDRGL